MAEKQSVTIDGVRYVREGSQKEAARKKGMPYVIVRTYSAGVFAGYLESRKGREAVLVDSRMIWKWDGAAALSQLAMEGVKKPENCMFCQVVSRREVTEVIEVLSVTEAAQKNISEVPEWKK